MEEGFPKLKLALSFKRRFEYAASGSDSENEAAPPRYTSLKDIISSSSPCSSDQGNSSDPFIVHIRNQLVKQAAAAYVLSATTVASKGDEGWILWLGERMKMSFMGLFSWWQMHVRPELYGVWRRGVRFSCRVFCGVESGLREDGEEIIW